MGFKNGFFNVFGVHWLGSNEEVRAVSFEIATVGMGGLDYTTSDRKYTLTSLPGEEFSGLQLMCLMYAGFARIAPEQDVGVDLDQPYREALALYQRGKGGAG